MAQPQVLEGTWEEILSHNTAQLAGRRVKIVIEPEESIMSTPTSPPNEQALAMLRDLIELQKGMNETSGEETDQRLREARAGGLYGLQPIE